MRTYHQLTSEERYALSTLRKQGYTVRGIARVLGRAPSTISREVHRNSRKDGGYRHSTAHDFARWRRSRSRRNQRFGADDWALVLTLLKQQWSPEQIAGRLKRDGLLRISHETIYRHIWSDKRRPAHVEARTEIGHWEIDTVLGSTKPCIVTLVERATGYVIIGKLKARTVAELNRATLALISDAPLPVRTITADNGTEFHGYSTIEKRTGVRFYFATPHHSWERGTNENANGLIRQYLPKRTSMARLSHARCDSIADRLNTRPRKPYDFLTPKEAYDSRCD